MADDERVDEDGDERAVQRAGELGIEEGGQEVADTSAQAEAMLADSDERQEDREGTAVEHRRSQDTTPPT